MRNRNNLIKRTEEFFLRHWDKESSPEWDLSWKWCGSVPNYKLGGLYALFRGDELLYIGLGNSRGGGSYTDCGISRRLIAHVIKTAPVNTDVSYILRERWSKLGIDCIATIGFPVERNYLSPALEDYLIGELNPRENSNKRKSDS